MISRISSNRYCSVTAASVKTPMLIVRTAGAFSSGTVYINATSNVVTFVPGVMDRERGNAFGYYNNTINETGFGVLEIQTRLGNLTDNNLLMYAAGYLEGVLTAR